MNTSTRNENGFVPTRDMGDAPQVAYEQSAPEAYMDHRQQEQSAPKVEAYAHWDETQNLDAPSPPATIFGLRRRNFWILFAVVVLVVGATIGGSVGGAMAVQRSDTKPEPALSASPTVLSMATSTLAGTSPNLSATLKATSTPIVPRPESVAELDISCPNSLTDYNDKPYDCVTGTNIVLKGDITGFVAYTVQQCIDACSTFNQVAGNTTCKAVVIGEGLSTDYKTNKGANCWLKNIAGPTEVFKGVTFAKLRT